MAVLKKADILQAVSLRRVEVEVPEWGGSVVVQEFSALQRDQFEGMVTRVKGKTVEPDLFNFRAKLVAASVIDPETGELLFGAEDVAKLGGLSAKALDRVAQEVLRLNDFSAEDVEELQKN